MAQGPILSKFPALMQAQCCINKCREQKFPYLEEASVTFAVLSKQPSPSPLEPFSKNLLCVALAILNGSGSRGEGLLR